MREIKTYAIVITTDELYENMETEKGKALLTITKNQKGFMGIAPLGYAGFAFLFRGDEQRNAAFEEMKKAGYETAEPIKENVYIDTRYLPEGMN